jgi:cellulose synthase/poly-beta-1,6-N-acetylglucosamine synthase-like glycosyltransferase
MSLSYSVVIAVDRVDKPLPVLEGLKKLPATQRPREVFACVGKNPSLQRNTGVSLSKAPMVYFLDDDSVVEAGTPKMLLSHFEDPRTVVAGGPNLVPLAASSFERTVNAVLASWMGSFKVRSRYAAIGSVREATEKELILCNMMVRRQTFTGEGGFRPDLYPNEENEFLNRLLHKGFRLVYDPRGAVYRSRRKSLWAFCYQAFRYGRGRARQIKVYPTLSDLVHLAPLFFVLYVLSLDALCLPRFQDLGWPFLASALFPLFTFSLFAFLTGVSAASWHRRWMDALKVPVLIFLRHFFYGWGLAAGFLTSMPKPDMAVKVFKVTLGPKNRFTPVKAGKK